MAETLGAVIVAAGSGTRMAGMDKVFALLAGRPLLSHTLTAFQECPAVTRIALVLSAANMERGRALASDGGLGKVSAICPGGERRQDSVRIGLEALGACDWVAVHDGARPLVTGQLIAAGLQAARETGAAIPALPLADTVKEAGVDGRVARTLDRSRLWAVQTPQIFRYDTLLRAHREVTTDVTDDAAMLETIGEPVKLFAGDRRNIKVTTPEDLALAEALLATRDMGQKTGTVRAGADGCPFCDFQEHEFEVYRDDEVFAVVDMLPINKYHLLVIPTQHYTSLAELPDELLGHVAIVVKRLSRALRKVARPDALTHLSDDDVTRSGFNLVEHFKFHLIPRHVGDRVRIDWGRGPAPRPADRAQAATDIRAALC